MTGARPEIDEEIDGRRRSSAEGPPTLPEVLERHAGTRAEHVAIRFLERGEAVTAEATYGELGARVASLASGLHRDGLTGLPVVLALPAGLDFVIALLACMRAGAIAVPMPFPATGEAARRLDLILDDLGSGAVLTACDTSVDVRGLKRLDPAMLAVPGGSLPPLPPADAPAVVQYSSGSTRAPQGIVISHGNIAANETMIGELFETGPSSVYVNWLPPHHDMGLFGAILQPLFFGATAVLMPPFAFVQRPQRWLDAIARHGGTVAGAPNFGYDLCVRRVPAERVPGLDLSTLEIAFCGAEPIRADSLRRFAAHFAPAGLNPAALQPCYGLAEATLLVTSMRKGSGVREIPRRDARAERRHVSCGEAPAGCEVTIRDPRTGALLPQSAVGEICVRGPHVAAGWWNGTERRVEPLAEVDGSGAERLLHTGDIGTLTEEGLVILDRIKDIVIVHGQNIYSSDIEAAALDAAGGVLPAAAAFAVVGDAGERLVVVCEIARGQRRSADLALLRQTLSEAVGQCCGLMPVVELTASGRLPRTTSGKIRRHATKEAFVEGTLSLLAKEAPEWASA